MNYENEYYNNLPFNPIKVGCGALLGIITIILIFASTTSVPANHVGIVYNGFGGGVN